MLCKFVILLNNPFKLFICFLITIFSSIFPLIFDFICSPIDSPIEYNNLELPLFSNFIEKSKLFNPI